MSRTILLNTFQTITLFNKALRIINFIFFFLFFLNYIYNNIFLKNIYINIRPIIPDNWTLPVDLGHSFNYGYINSFERLRNRSCTTKLCKVNFTLSIQHFYYNIVSQTLKIRNLKLKLITFGFFFLLFRNINIYENYIQ